jgi:hypothetical protein
MIVIKSNSSILIKINHKFHRLGIHLGTEFGNFIKFKDGVLIIEKYNKL